MFELVSEHTGVNFKKDLKEQGVALLSAMNYLNKINEIKGTPYFVGTPHKLAENIRGGEHLVEDRFGTADMGQIKYEFHDTSYSNWYSDALSHKVTGNTIVFVVMSEATEDIEGVSYPKRLSTWGIVLNEATRNFLNVCDGVLSNDITAENIKKEHMETGDFGISRLERNLRPILFHYDELLNALTGEVKMESIGYSLEDSDKFYELYFKAKPYIHNAVYRPFTN